MSSPRVQTALRRLGDDVRTARKKRRMPVKDFAERIGVTEGTLARLERGDPGIRLETLAMALLVLGELGRLEALLDPGSDDAGLMLDRKSLPKRIDRQRRHAAAAPDAAGEGAPAQPAPDGDGEAF